MKPGFKPMLSAKVPTDLTKIKYPVLVSPKLDGIRCVVDENGDAFTRNMKPIPNDYVRATIKISGLRNVDGELIVGEPTGHDVINRTSSGIMKKTGEPEFTYWIFDNLDNPKDQFEWRWKDAARKVGDTKRKWARVVKHVICGNANHLDDYAARRVAEGFEGAMLRSMAAQYKFGRSTPKEGGLLKLKFWDDDEFLIFGAIEQLHNDNEQTRDELGRSKRSKKKAGMVATGMLGALVGQTKTGVEFEIGTGFTEAQRKELWTKRDEIESGGFYATVKYQGFTPAGAPRFPTFVNIRNDI